MNKRKIFIILFLVFVVSFVVYYKKDLINKDHTLKVEKIYYCPMHPEYTSNKPGSCPICGMDLVLKENEDEMIDTDEEESKKYHDVSNKKNTIKISDEKKQMIGVKTIKADYRNLEYEIIAPAYIAYDPELYNALYEYKEALKIEENLRNSKSENIENLSDSFIRSAKLKLKILGLSDDEIKEISESDFSGLITNQDSEYLWAYIEVHENDLSLIKIGDVVELMGKAYGNMVFKGVIKIIDSIVNPQTRRARIRAIVENKDKLLKQQNYLEARIKVKIGNKLSIPIDCILDTGNKKIIYVEKENGIFEKRIVKTGLSDGKFVEIKEGLRYGEMVVREGNFMIDSESKLKGID